MTPLTPAEAPDARVVRSARLREAHAWITAHPWPAVVLDPAGTILAVNRAWKAVAARHRAAPEACGIGVDYLAVCDLAASDLEREAAAFGEGLRRVLLGQSHRFELACPGPLPSRALVLRLDRLPGSAVVVLHRPGGETAERA